MTTETLTLTDFLLARIAEDEAAARAWNLDRVLAECAAKRAIVAEHGGSKPFYVDPCDAHDAAFKTIPCDTIRHLASIYADHPDYRDDWQAVT